MQRYETHPMEQPLIPFIFLNTFHCSPSHVSCICNWHENVELLIVTKGRGTVQINEQTIPVEKGDIAVISTNQIHDIFSKDSMEYSCLIIDRTFFLQNGADSNKFTFQPLIRDPKLLHLVERFEKEFQSAEDTPYRAQALRSYALQILLILLRDYSNENDETKSEKKIHLTIKNILGKIRAESHTDISLESIAKEEGWSKYYLAREFRRLTGQTLVSFLNMVRCEKAKTMLKESNMNVGEIGRACGFKDQTYFTRKFRARTGKTPGEYRKSHKKEH